MTLCPKCGKDIKELLCEKAETVRCRYDGEKYYSYEYSDIDAEFLCPECEATITQFEELAEMFLKYPKIIQELGGWSPETRDILSELGDLFSEDFLEAIENNKTVEIKDEVIEVFEKLSQEGKEIALRLLKGRVPKKDYVKLLALTLLEVRK